MCETILGMECIMQFTKCWISFAVLECVISMVVMWRFSWGMSQRSGDEVIIRIFFKDVMSFEERNLKVSHVDTAFGTCTLRTYMSGRGTSM